jgi:hypothetical protein
VLCGKRDIVSRRWGDSGYRQHRVIDEVDDGLNTRLAKKAHFSTLQGIQMRRALALILSLSFAGAAFAEGPTCAATAAEKKLAGAAKTSFMKKCQADAKASCEAQATEKKLAGAAKASFTKKCVKDAG